MKRIVLSMLLAFMLVFAVVPTVFAQDGMPPVEGCPVGFTLHHFGEHEGEGHEHVHVGLEVDLNGDHQICVKEVSEHFHVHVDNVIR